PGTLQLRLDARVDLALGGAHDRAAAGHARVGLKVERLQTGGLALQRAERLADRLDVLPADEDRDRALAAAAPQRALHHTDYRLRADLERRRQDLPGQRQP